MVLSLHLTSFGLRSSQLLAFRKAWTLPPVASETEISSFLQTCTQHICVEEGSIVHARIIKTQLFSIFLFNHLMNMYAKCGCLEDAQKVLDEMPERNVVSWSVMIAGCVQHDYPNLALDLFLRMQREGVVPNHFTLVSVLNACSLTDLSSHAKQIYVRVLQLGFQSNVFIVNAFIATFVCSGNLLEASEFFEKAQSRDIVSWNTMITGYVQFASPKVWSFWCRMNHECIVFPDHFTFTSILAGLAAVGAREHGPQTHTRLVKSGFESDTCVGNALLDMYMKCGYLEEGLQVFDEMYHRNIISWTEIIAGCLHHGYPRKALELFQDMKLLGITPNEFTLATAINSCANLVSLEEGKKIHVLRVKLAKQADHCVDNAVIDMYAKCGCIDDAIVVFRTMKEHSVISWTTIIMGCAQNGRSIEAMEFFERMCATKCTKPNHITYICVLYACSQGGFIDKGMSYFSSMIRDHGVQPGEHHYACMINMLGRTSRIAEAEALIHSMPNQPSLLLWKTLLSACRIHGDFEAGKRAAEQALLSDKCNASTYILLSNIYAELRSWDDVDEVRKTMEKMKVKKTPGFSWITPGG